jgi:hypothetical protein
MWMLAIIQIRGGIIRDSSSSFIVYRSWFIEHVVDASMAEVIALKEGLLMAQQIDLLLHK